MTYNRETLELMLAQKDPSLLQVMVQNVKEILKSEKLPFGIDGDITSGFKLVDVGDSTEAYLNRFITKHPTLIALKENILKLAKVEDDQDQLLTILIQGPTGTGKELLARALHGSRIGKFQAINCAGLPTELIESELFGHVKGAFTNAVEHKQGLMQASKTLFLDEIGDLPFQVQAKLLRAIQSKEIRRVGGVTDISINCRVVCATHKNLEQMVEENLFREDLYARISTFELHTIPLRDRTEDIEPIIQSMKDGDKFWKALHNKHQDSDRPALDYLDLKRNVRSLQQAVKRFIVLGKLP